MLKPINMLISVCKAFYVASKEKEHAQFMSPLIIAFSQTAKRNAPKKHKVQGKNKRTTPTKSKTTVIYYISEASETKIVPYFIKMQICMMHTSTPPPTMHPPKCTPTRALCQTHPTAGCQHPPGKPRSPPAGRACLQSCSGTPPPNRLREPDTGPPLRGFLSATPVKLLSRCHSFYKHLYMAQNASLPSCLHLKLSNYCWGWEEGTPSIGLIWEAAAAATSSAGVCVHMRVCVRVCVRRCEIILRLGVCVCMWACVHVCMRRCEIILWLGVKCLNFVVYMLVLFCWCHNFVVGIKQHCELILFNRGIELYKLKVRASWSWI